MTFTIFFVSTLGAMGFFSAGFVCGALWHGRGET